MARRPGINRATAASVHILRNMGRAAHIPKEHPMRGIRALVDEVLTDMSRELLHQQPLASDRIKDLEQLRRLVVRRPRTVDPFYAFSASS